MPSTCRFGVAFLNFLPLCLTHLRTGVEILNGTLPFTILYIREAIYTALVEGSQGTYYCYVCPDGTPPPMAGMVDPACSVNGSVLLTVLREFFSFAFKTILKLVIFCGVQVMPGGIVTVFLGIKGDIVCVLVPGLNLHAVFWEKDKTHPEP